MLKAIGAGALIGTGVPGSAAASHGVYTAHLRPVNDDAAGNEVSGRLRIEDDGSTLAVSGTATGMDSSNDDISITVGPCGQSSGYISLFYDKGSAPSGPEACEPGPGVRESMKAFAMGAEQPDTHPLALTIPEMHAAKWDVASDGTGTARRMNVLNVVIPLFNEDGDFIGCSGPIPIPKAYVSADRIGTVSIRDARINDGFGPDAVVACGPVTHEGSGE